MKKYIGDKAFYAAVITVLIPIVLQNFVTNFVNLLDNMMVGQLGTLEFSGVSIVNQLVTVYNLVIFGSMSAVGIFSAQYAGNKDYKGMKQCLHLKMIVGTLVFLLCCGILLTAGNPLIGLYLDESTNTAADIAATLSSARSYMMIILVGLLPFALVQAFSTTLRENGDTVLPMAGSIAAVLVNFVFNWLLIFGNLGFPELGVAGAAIATSLSRFVELGVLLTASLTHRSKYPFLSAEIPFLSVPLDLIQRVLKGGTPLVFNELMFSLGTAFIAQCYSTRGLNAVAAVNMTMTITHLFTIIVYGMGSTISILVGQALGAGEHEKALDIDLKLIALSVFLCVIIGTCMFAVSPLIPKIYNTSDEVKNLACSLLRISSCMLPVQAVYLGSYFTLRCGGKTVITMLFDSGYMCGISFPMAFCLSHFTALPIFFVYLLVTCCDIPKALTGFYLVRKGIWVNTII